MYGHGNEKPFASPNRKNVGVIGCVELRVGHASPSPFALIFARKEQSASQNPIETHDALFGIRRRVVKPLHP